MVTVELRNNASHHVHVKCGVEEFKEEMMLLNAGDAISWEFREILFPLKWCYVHIDNDNQGFFWASHLLEIIIKNQNGGSNGKLEEIPRVESEDEIKEVILEELKTEVESVTVSAVDENSEAVNENHDEEPNEKSPPQVVDSGEFQEEKEVTVSVVDSVTQSEELISDGEEAAAVVQIIDALVTSLDSKETEEASNEINGVPENDGISPVVTKEVSKVIEEIKLPSLEENGEVPLPVAINEEKSREIEDTKLLGSIQNTGESSYTADKEYKQEVDKSLPALANSGNVENITDADEIADNPEIFESN
ncbi:hypothetical protein LWI29_023540 [Acer saccharum]|uniref:Uncharacterized protein n=1 Tax=Acer saccharum TaxID=4024 RepID=A0AA39SFP1_ACESA|nr:hypothetical protein LWI29_023540 [Acer saccharum]